MHKRSAFPRYPLFTCVVLAGLVFAPAMAMAQANDAKLAVQLAQTSASVKPGDVVVIFGGKHTLPLMEMVAIEVQKAGGQVNMMLQSDRVARSYWTEVKDQYLKQVPEYWGPWLGEVDVWIGLPGIENPPEVFGDIPQERFALGAASNQMFNDILNSTPLRGIAISYPSEIAAKQNGLSYESYAKMQWDAINADYAAISRSGKALAAKLRGAQKVRISSPAGTNVDFSMGDRPVFIDDGIVTPEDVAAAR